MLKIFQNLQASAFIVAISIFGAFQIAPFLASNDIPALDIGNFSCFFNSVNSNVFLSRILNLTLVILGAFMLNNLVLRNEIIYKQTALTFLFYLLFSLIIPAFSFFSTFTIINFLSILLLNEIIAVHDNADSNYQVFKAASIIGLGSIFHVGFIAALIILLFGVSRFKPISLFVIMLTIIGASFPMLALFTILYTNPDLAIYFSLNNFTQTSQTASALYLITIIPFFLLLAFSGFIWTTNLQRNTVKTRRTIQIILVQLFIMFITSFFYWGASWNVFELLQVPASIVFAYFFSSSKSPRLRNTLFFILLLSILFSQIALKFYLV